jgi:hypothetical protein
MRFLDNASTSGRSPVDLLWSLSACLVLAWGLCLVACGGTDGADRTDRPERTTEISPERLSSMETPCGSNSSLTAASLLEQLDPPYTAPIESPSDPSTSSTVQLDVEYDGGFRRCFPWDRATRRGTPRLQLAVTLELQTDDGRLDPTVPGTISVLQGSDDVRFTGTIAADELDDASLARTTSGHRDGVETDEPQPDLLIEGWLQTDRPGFQGAVRLRQTTSETRFEHQTLVSWDEPPPSSSG